MRTTSPWRSAGWSGRAAAWAMTPRSGDTGSLTWPSYCRPLAVVVTQASAPSRCPVVALLIGERAAARGALHAPPGGRHARLGRLGHVRRARRAGEPRRARARRHGRGARRPGRVVGRHLARGAADLRRAREARCGVRAGERPPRRRRGRGRRRVRPARGCCSSTTTRAGQIARVAASPLVAHAELDAAAAAGVGGRRRGARRSTSATRTSSSSRAAAPGRPKGVVLSHRANFLRSYPNLARATSPGGTVCMFPLFHMAGWSMALGAWQTRAPIHFVRDAGRATRSSAAAERRARAAAVPASRRCGRACSSTTDRATTSRPLREADTGTSATPPELARRDPGRVPRTRSPASSTGRPRRARRRCSADGDVAAQAGLRRAAPARVSTSRLADDGEVCVRSELLMDGYFEQPDATAERCADRRTAGTTPATSACSTTRATCRSSVGPAT